MSPESTVRNAVSFTRLTFVLLRKAAEKTRIPPRVSEGMAAPQETGIENSVTKGGMTIIDFFSDIISISEVSIRV